MNKIYLVLITLIFALLSCGGSEGKENSEISDEDNNENMEEAMEGYLEGQTSKYKNCDEFLDAYEKWIDAYLEVLEKYMKNPMDPTLSEEYLNSAQELQSWTMEWMKIYTCAMNKKYQKRFETIAEKAEKKMKEIGLK